MWLSVFSEVPPTRIFDQISGVIAHSHTAASIAERMKVASIV
jgi:hypothetical protein